MIDTEPPWANEEQSLSPNVSERMILEAEGDDKGQIQGVSSEAVSLRPFHSKGHVLFPPFMYRGSQGELLRVLLSCIVHKTLYSQKDFQPQSCRLLYPAKPKMGPDTATQAKAGAVLSKKS